MSKKVVVITGASSGIGEATARRLASEGNAVVVGARRSDRLEKLVGDIRAAGGTADFRTVDVTRREDVAALVTYAKELHGRVDVMVNNAGLMPLSPLDKLHVDEWDQMIDVNIKGVLYGIAAALENDAKHIVNISSIAAHSVLPTGAVYCATKYAVNAISEGLRQEKQGTGLRVTVVSPGVTESELAGTITDPGTAQLMGQFRENAIPADAVAQAISYAIDQPEGVQLSEIIVRPTGGH